MEDARVGRQRGRCRHLPDFVEMGGMRRLGKEQIYRIKLRTSLKPASLGRVVYLIVHVIHNATSGSAGRLPGVHKSMHEESGASER